VGLLPFEADVGGKKEFLSVNSDMHVPVTVDPSLYDSSSYDA
jgi:hypothetical protein